VGILDPVSPFLSLIDRIISLVKERETKRREYFEKIIEPLYIQFKPLGEDYLRLFRDAQAVIQSSKKRPRANAASAIKKKREEFAATRAQLRALLNVCEKNAVKRKDEELAEFVRAMVQFFQPMVPDSSMPSLGVQLVDFFQLWRHGDSRYLAFLPAAVARLEACWYEISGRYMELKLKSLGE